MAEIDDFKNLVGKARLDSVIYYAIDKASPYTLAFHVQTDNLDKITPYTLAGLSITEKGTALMWLWINASCQPEAKPVSPDVSSKCTNVKEVRLAVYANATGKP